MTWLVVAIVPLALLLAPTVGRIASRATSSRRPVDVARGPAGAAVPTTPPAPGPEARPPLSVCVVVPRGASGRPGFTVWLPGTPVGAREPHHERDCLVRVVGLGPGAVLAVRALGAVADVGAAAERPGRVIAGRGEWRGWAEVGPVRHGEVPAGPVVVRSLGAQSGRMVTEWHLDHGGWAFLVVVATTNGHRHGERVAAAVVATWSWEVAQPWPAQWR